LKYGLHFRNNLSNNFSNNVTGSGIQGSIILGAHGTGTEVAVSGNIENAQGQAFPSLVVTNGGKIRFTGSAQVNLILPGSFFTRQFWILGDGSGAIEFDSGFVADRTQGGTLANGLGSIRLSNAKLITHHTRSLPLGYRPNPSMINSHLVFENEPGSEWIVASTAQDYKGGLWIRKSLTVNTQTDLILSGVRSVWPDYVNFGGIHFEESDGNILTKKGAARLLLSGEHGYRPGSSIVCQEGMVEFATDAFNEADSAFYASRNRVHGRNLIFRLQAGGSLKQSVPTLRLRHLYAPAGGLIHTNLLHTLIADTIVLNAANFNIIIPNGISLTEGDTFQLFKALVHTSINTPPDLPTFGNSITWDLSRFGTHGVVKVASGSVVTSTGVYDTTLQSFTLFPNPATRQLQTNISGQLIIFDMMGKEVLNRPVEAGVAIVLPRHIRPGTYSAKVLSTQGKIFRQKLLVHQE
jgi:hypothetical protein